MKKISRFFSFVMICALVMTSTGMESFVYASESIVSNMMDDTNSKTGTYEISGTDNNNLIPKDSQQQIDIKKEETEDLEEESKADVEDISAESDTANEEILETEEESKTDVENTQDESDKANEEILETEEESKTDVENTQDESDKANGEVIETGDAQGESDKANGEGIKTDEEPKADGEDKLVESNEQGESESNVDEEEIDNVTSGQETEDSDVKVDESSIEENMRFTDDIKEGTIDIDLRNAFTIVSYAYNQYTDKVLKITEIESNIEKNKIRMTNPELTNIFSGIQNDRNKYNYQTTIVQSKDTYDLTRPFILEGAINLGNYLKASDGLSIAFHNDEDYISKFKGGPGATLGVYPTPDYTGITKGIVAEFDTWGNTPSNTKGGAYVGDNSYGRHSGESDAHVDINGILGKPVSGTSTVKNLTKDNTNLGAGWWIGEAYKKLGGESKFTLIWNPSSGTTGTMKFYLGNYYAIATIDISTYITDPTHTYLTFSTVSGGGTIEPYKPDNVYFTFNSFQYTDISSEMIFEDAYVNHNKNWTNNSSKKEYYDNTVAIKDRNLDKFLTRDDQLEVIYSLRNNISVSHTVSEKITLSNRTIKKEDGTRLNLKLVRAKYQIVDETDWIDLSEEQLNFLRNGEGIKIEYPANSKVFRLSCYFELPDNYSYVCNDGDLPTADITLKTGGESGMSYKELKLSQPVAVAPNAQGDNFDIGVNQILAENALQQNFAVAKTYDDVGERHPLIEANDWGMEVIDEKYYYFDDAQNQFVQIEDSPEGKAKEIFLNHSKTKAGETGVYMYQFTVKDVRRTEISNSLTDTTQTRIFLTKNDKESQAVRGNGYIILANDSSITLSETKMSEDYTYNTTLFLNDIKKELSIKVYKDGGGFNLTKVEAHNIKLDLGTLDETNPIPGDYTVNVDVYDDTGVKVLTKPIKVTITENTWSYNTDKRTEENGASGFIVIPKVIQLQNSQKENKLNATEEVFFANYRNATDVKYDVSVDKTFELTKTDNKSSTILVTSYSDLGIDSGDNKLYLGEMNYRYVEGFGYEVHFSAPNDEASRYKGRWTGNVTFYFERK